jgi:sugar/nucleoside kinase (ribokinase family)
MIAVVGQSVLDRVRGPGVAPAVRLGGAPLFAGRALTAEGRSAVVLTRGGTPELRAPLGELPCEIVVGPADRTFVSELELLPDGDRHHSLGSLGDPFTPADVAGWMAPALAEVRVVVAGAQWRDDFPPETLEALGASGREVYLDGQGPARPARLGPVQLEGPLDPAWVRGVTVLKVSEEEAAALLGGADPAAARRSGIPTVVVTRGEVGAVVLRDGRATSVAAQPVRGLADTVGAGDAFLALMAAAAADGASPEGAADLACHGVARMLRARLRSADAGAADRGS